jgi:hypothetical protein
MPQFADLPRSILLAISTLSGEEYRDVEGEELKEELAGRGYTPDDAVLVRAMHALRDSAFVDATFGGGFSIHLIRLAPRGRQEVEGWPAEPGAVSSSDVEELVSAFLARAEDPEVSAEDRGRLRAAADALRDVSVGVSIQVISTWLKMHGVA